MIDLNKKFEDFSNGNFYSRIDNIHPLEIHIGLDEKKRKSIELRANFKVRKITGTAVIEINQYKRDDYCTLRFSLCDNEMSGLFYIFCEDLIEQTRQISDTTESYTAILNRFFKWKKMFISSNGVLLTEPEILGLIGEVLFLKSYLMGKIGASEALKSWSGQELTHKDFSWNNTWYEVKSISLGSKSVKISSLEQLDSEFDGELVIFTFEKMSEAYNGITLNKLIVDTVILFERDDDKEIFLSKVAMQGYEYNNYYDAFVYEMGSFTRILVSEDFPKLTKSNLPIEIYKVTYELLLADLRHCEIK